MIVFSLSLEDPSLADRVEGFLYENPELPWSVTAYPNGTAQLQGYFPDKVTGENLLQGMREEISGLPEPVVKEIADEDWKQSYRFHLQIRRFDKLVWVPIWERLDFESDPGDAVVYLDSGMAFGTGSHETTRYCARQLVAYAKKHGSESQRVFDAGSGSGILALSAVRLGFPDVYAFDNDPEAVAVARENAAMNDCNEEVVLETAGVTEGLSGRKAEVVLANIETHVLREHVMDLLGAVVPGGWLIMSGILAKDRLDLERHFMRAARLQWPEGATLEADEDGEWAGVTVIRER